MVNQVRWLPLSGIAFVVLGLLAVIVIGGDTPDVDASASKVARFYDAHTGRQAVASFVLAASVAFLALFGVQLAAALSVARGERVRIWSRLLTVGTALASAALLLAALTHFALADAADHGVSGDAIRALNILDSDSWIAWNAAFGVMMLGAGGTILSTAGLLPRWLGWAAILFGVLLFIPYVDFPALLLTLLWIVIVSVMLWRSREQPLAAAPETTS
jgi:hypothetical protein